MNRRYELSDDQWEILKEYLAETTMKRRGRPWKSLRQTVNGIFWILFSGAPWRDMPERYGHWRTVYGNFVRWRRDGTFDRMLSSLRMRLNQEGLLDWSIFGIDSTTVKSTKAASGAKKKGFYQKKVKRFRPLADPVED